MLVRLNGDETSVNVNRTKYEANELIVNIFGRSFLWDCYYLLLLSCFLSAGFLDGVTAVIGVTAQPAAWD